MTSGPISKASYEVLVGQAQSLICDLWRPGTDQIAEVIDLDIAPDGAWGVFTGAVLRSLETDPAMRIGRIDLSTGAFQIYDTAPGNSRSPRISPDCSTVAFLHADGDEEYQLQLLDCVSGNVTAAPQVAGRVEYFHWSPDGTRVLIAGAPPGIDLAAAQGGLSTASSPEDRPSWFPTIQTPENKSGRRCVWTYAPGGKMNRIEVSHNIWEATWCGPGRIVAIISSGGDESDWYDARLAIITLDDWVVHELAEPEGQLGCVTANRGGSRIAWVESLGSDRGVIAGDLNIWSDGILHRAATHGVDVSSVAWLDENQLLCTGIRGPETVVLRYDAVTGQASRLWSGIQITGAGRYPAVVAVGASGDFAFAGEGFCTPPHIAIVRSGEYEMLRSFGPPSLEIPIARAEPVQWVGEEGVIVDGWLLEPARPRPHALVMAIHGGPVWQWRPTWWSRPRFFPFYMLLARGYAIFLPNPRGSGGRGQSFARLVVGDTGGGDAGDLLRGIDHLIDCGIADANRLGVTGVSYGGFMSAWLVTRDHRFAAAVPVAPAINRVSQQLTANHWRFLEIFLQDRYDRINGEYLKRSPIMHAPSVRTPTLLICGALDRCTPPSEAAQFYNALVQNDVKSALVTYPCEGHGIHHIPALIDYVARLADWLDQHMPAHPGGHR